MRARDLGITIGLLETGPANAITDVPGVRVGHANRPGHTGVTVIAPRGGGDHWLSPWFGAADDLNGAGELTGGRQLAEWGVGETPIFLTATPYVGAVYEAATRLLAERQPRIGVDDVVIPIVGETDPSDYCDVREGPTPDIAMVREALDGLSGGPVAEGQVGAGVGMSLFRFAGGIGTASRLVDGWTVGVLIQGNFGDRERLTVDGRQLGRELPEPIGKGAEGSALCVVGTDAPLNPLQLRRLARRAFLGLARTGSYASNGSGEIAVAFSTANAAALERDRADDVVNVAMVPNVRLSGLFAAAVEASEEAILNALAAGTRLDGATGMVLDALPHDALRVAR